MTIVLCPCPGARPTLDQSQLALDAADTPYGAIAVRGHAGPVRVTVAAPGLPPVELVAPTRVGGPRLRCVGPDTRLTVAGVTAALTQHPRGLTRGRRALRIALGQTAYRWAARSLLGTSQLTNDATGPVAVTGWRAGDAVITLESRATPTDAAVALAVTVGLDADPLHILRVLAP
jgi:hypothetical protein